MLVRSDSHRFKNACSHVHEGWARHRNPTAAHLRRSLRLPWIYSSPKWNLPQPFFPSGTKPEARYAGWKPNERRRLIITGNITREHARKQSEGSPSRHTSFGLAGIDVMGSGGRSLLGWREREYIERRAGGEAIPGRGSHYYHRTLRLSSSLVPSEDRQSPV